MAVCDYTALGQGDDALRPYDGDGRGACDFARLPYGGLNLQGEAVGLGYFNLRRASHGTEHAHVFDGAK